uniref:Uncharacterized protein n=1 Tax=Ditylenchus dipsaci TaxID=166011 RepID=A0A915E618_9BILA
MQLHDCLQEKKQLRQNIVKELDSINRITSLNRIQKIIEHEVLEKMSDDEAVENTRMDVKNLVNLIGDEHALKQLNTRIKNFLLSTMAYNTQLIYLRNEVIELVVP